MSAFIVTDDHINTLVNYAIAHKASYYFANSRITITGENGEQIAQKLLDENYRSVNYRYRNEYGKPHKIAFKVKRAVTTPAVQILKSISCLDYQSCETDDWEQTEARAILNGIQNAAIRALPGYEEAKWG